MSQEQLSIILLVRAVIKLFNIVIIDSVSEFQIFMNREKFNFPQAHSQNCHLSW